MEESMSRRVLGRLLPLAISAAALPGARLDTTTFVVLGDGLAAGVADVGLYERCQHQSFGAQFARQVGAIFPQAHFQAPGPGDVPGEPGLPVRLPAYPQGSVRTPFPPTLFVFNVSIPGLTLGDAVSRRPALPLIRPNDSFQTLLNLTIGFPSLILDQDVPLWSPVEYAVAMNPTLALVELGYADTIEAAVSGDPSRLADAAAFRSRYRDITRRLRATFAEVIVTTIPDPTATAYFTDVAAAPAALNQPASLFAGDYGLAPGDLLAGSAICEISYQLLAGRTEPLAAGRILRAADAARIRERVRAWNSEIAAIARDEGAQLYDLAALFARLGAGGIPVAGRRLTNRAFGGFFSLDGFHPGATGHALIANELLALVNRTYQTSFAPIDVARVAQGDPVFAYRAPDVGW